MDPRKARREAFMKRQQLSKQVSEGGGLGFFKSNLQGVNFWKCGEGPHDFDIIPYVTGPNDPKFPEGTDAYILEVYEHRDVGGIEGQSFICLAKTYKKPCPICEYRAQLQKEGGADDDTLKALRPSGYPRSIYNVLVYDSTVEEDKGVQVWHTSHWLMERHLAKLAESSSRDIAAGHPPYKLFADPEEGYSVRFTRDGQGRNTQYVAHQLVQRNYMIGDDILEQAYQLDQLIHIPTYDEVYAAFWGEDIPTDAQEAEERPVRARSTRNEAKQRKAVPPKAEKPKGRASRRSAPILKEEEEEFGENDELPESLQTESDKKESKARAKTKAKAKGNGNNELTCPAGGNFGHDAYELEHCEECGHWEACYEENQRILSAEGGSEVEEEQQELVEEEQEEEKPKTRRARGASRGNGARAPRGNGARTRKAAPKEDAPPPRAVGRGRGRGRGRAIVR